MAAPRRRRTNYRRPPRRRTTTATRRPATRKNKAPAAIILITGSSLLAIGSPLVGVPILLMVLLALWIRAGGGSTRLTSIRARGRMRTAPTTANYMTLSSKQFEYALADLCRRDGCTNIRVVGGAGDLGADVIATTPNGQRLVIQAKRYAPTTKVGSGDVQKVGGTARQIHGADIAAVVTTSVFTPAASDYCRQVGIRTLDGTALGRWASRTGPAPWH